MWMLGLEFRSSCLHGKHFTNQATIPVSLFSFPKTIFIPTVPIGERNVVELVVSKVGWSRLEEKEPALLHLRQFSGKGGTGRIALRGEGKQDAYLSVN